MKYGLIGYPITHSFSPAYFRDKFENLGLMAKYELFPLEHIETISELVKRENLSGFNVTIPHKSAIIALLDEVDEATLTIGAVNTVVVQNGKMKGYNTDVIGFEKSLLKLIISPQNITKALVLGMGGSAKAVTYILDKLKIDYSIVNRTRSIISYEKLTKDILKEYNLIINTTPLGMYPNVDICPKIPYEAIDKKYFLYDLIYNPEKTLFLSEGLKRGAKTMNGHDMLMLQAEAAWEIWNKELKP